MKYRHSITILSLDNEARTEYNEICTEYNETSTGYNELST